MNWGAANNTLKTDMAAFTTETLKSKDDLDGAVKTLERSISLIINNIPCKEINSNKPALPSSIRNKIKEKRKLRREFMKSRNPLDKSKLNKIQNDIKKEIKEYKDQEQRTKNRKH